MLLRTFLILVFLGLNMPAWGLSNDACSLWIKGLKQLPDGLNTNPKSEAFQLGEDYGYYLAKYLGHGLFHNTILKKRCDDYMDLAPEFTASSLIEDSKKIPSHEFFESLGIKECLYSHLTADEELKQPPLIELSASLNDLQRVALKKFDEMEAQITPEIKGLTARQMTCTGFLTGLAIPGLEAFKTQGLEGLKVNVIKTTEFFESLKD